MVARAPTRGAGVARSSAVLKALGPFGYAFGGTLACGFVQSGNGRSLGPRPPRVGRPSGRPLVGAERGAVLGQLQHASVAVAVAHSEPPTLRVVRVVPRPERSSHARARARAGEVGGGWKTTRNHPHYPHRPALHRLSFPRA